VQPVVNFRQRDVQVAAVHRQISRHRRRRSVFHELVVERAADAHGGKAIAVNQLGQRQRGFGQPMRTQPGNDIDTLASPVATNT